MRTILAISLVGLIGLSTFAATAVAHEEEVAFPHEVAEVVGCDGIIVDTDEPSVRFYTHNHETEEHEDCDPLA